MGPMPWVTCVGAMGAHRACCALSFWRGCPSGLRRLRQTVACGLAPKWRLWVGGELGLAEVLPQRGWEALKAIDWSVQKPRPRHPASATPEEREAFKKSWS